MTGDAPVRRGASPAYSAIMTASTTTTPIRVSVHFKETSVFAGEDVECTITFTNVTQTNADLPPPGGGSKQLLHPERGRKPLPVQRPPSVAGSVSQSVTHSIAPTLQSSAVPPSASIHQLGASRKSSLQDPSGAAAAATAGRARGHRPALSLNTPSAPGTRPPSAVSNGQNNGSTTPATPGQHQHTRSLSIFSVGSPRTPGENNGNGTMGPTPRRPGKGHGRSSSLQVIPNKISPGGRSPLQPSPNSVVSPPAFTRSRTDFIPIRIGRRTSGPGGTPTGTGSNTPNIGATRKTPELLSQAFKFPAALEESPTLKESPTLTEKSPALEVSPAEELFAVPRTRPPSGTPSLEKLAPSPVTRIISSSSMNGTPRSSGEFNYPASNNSSDTLVSEYPSRPTSRLFSGLRTPHEHRPSQLGPGALRNPKQPEVLMMGYAQVMGSFTLDGSLVNQAPFEEVKRKGVVGGQGGGGVVGVERTKRESGLFGALGWSNIGESLGGLLGGSEPSSIREMRATASSKTVPLLSTPQSILFVDLKLAPGESKSYKYSFTMPRGLPPTHKGRAMKVSYHLSIGTQRPGSARDQKAVRSVNVPFRVFGSVTSRGEILGHDLMNPYIILRDQARVASLPETKAQAAINNYSKHAKSADEGKDSLSEFLEYVNKLMDRPPESANGLLSPTYPVSAFRRRRSTAESEPAAGSMKEAIDFAILRSNMSSPGNQSTNRFEIARNGRRVAVINLARPCYRLGETINCAIDFSRGQVPVLGVAVTLETSEKVDAAVALRSASSVHRATRKVHATFAESTLYARRVNFAPTVPATATPEFITSGVGLEWALRVEFITPRGNGGGGGGGSMLLEEMGTDDRGTVLAPVERLQCESFEVAVPVRVYGAQAGSTGPDRLAGDDEVGFVI